MKLMVYSSGNGRIMTQKGLFYIESLYHVEDIVIDDKTGDYFFIQDTKRDEQGYLKEIITE